MSGDPDDEDLVTQAHEAERPVLVKDILEFVAYEDGCGGRKIPVSDEDFTVVTELNPDDPPEDRWAIQAIRWDRERNQLVLQQWKDE